jgi:lipopolysaccharide export system permease protein
MPALAHRYILRETAQTWFAVTAVLLLILLTNQFASVLGDAASNRLPRDALFLVMGLTSVGPLMILIPIALFLSILLALGRLYRDSEMYAFMACGIGPAQLYRPLLLLAAVLTAIGAWLALDVAPRAAGEVKRIAQEARARADLRVMEAGRFVSFGRADAVVYAEQVTPDGRLRNVFVQRRSEAGIEVIVAQEAVQQETADPDVKMLTFSAGRRYEGEPGTGRFRIVEFREHGIPYQLPTLGALSLEPESRPLLELARSADPADVAELQWRLSFPLMTLVLAFLAVPLGKSSPRQGRYAGLAAGVLVFVSYATLLGASKAWLERGQLPAIVGLWWVHLAFAAGAALLLAARYGGLRRPGWMARRGAAT